jgi:hypothetical protein
MIIKGRNKGFIEQLSGRESKVEKYRMESDRLA